MTHIKDKKFIIIKKESKILSLLFHGGRLIQAGAEDEQKDILGNIYIGKVKNIADNIKAAFVETVPGLICFLPLNDVKDPILTNRIYDGRLMAGDELAVQISREALKTKQPAVTTALSLSGKYCVVSLKKPGISYSTKLSKKSRERIEAAIKDFFLPVKTDGAKTSGSEIGAADFGVIIRTNASQLDDFSPLEKELNELSAQLLALTEHASHRTCHSLLYKKPSAYLTRLRDLYENQCDEIVTDNETIFHEITEYRQIHPDFVLPDIRLYQDSQLPLYKLYSVETRLAEALAKKVWLKSGGYLIIEPTEALTVIDVNTGKVTGKKDNEKTYFEINMEAAGEIARQLTLRNLSGIIIVDFINMKSPESRSQLMAYLGNLLKRDAIKTNLVDITALGLVEITRMKTNKPLSEQLTNL